ncbi:DUF423 domain-containing protein [uncultured Enterovirga sp.]|uniref:DUF423 domain-containing protein n=1 Tax=uncultured Enterovirga sp. TaxID=2026352 RepID=UPI0035C955BC
MTGPAERVLLALGALAGLLGVGLSAAAAHISGGGSLETASRFLLVHAPVLLVLAALIGQALVHRGLGRIAGAGMVLGLALFCGDLSVRVLLGVAPVPMAAPIGGSVLMLAWAVLILAPFLRNRPS